MTKTKKVLCVILALVFGVLLYYAARKTPIIEKPVPPVTPITDVPIAPYLDPCVTNPKLEGCEKG